MIKAVIQRVLHAEVKVDEKSVGKINRGLLTLLGMGEGATAESTQKLIEKIVKLRIFEDQNGKMNQSILDVHGEHLIVSQFTLLADTQKGNRPSFIKALKPELASGLVDLAVAQSRQLGVATQTGVFGADMKVLLLNDGPVTIILEA